MLDDVEEVFVGAATDDRGVGEVAGTDQEERRSPRAASVRAVTRRAQHQIQSLAARSAGRWAGCVEEPGQPSGKDSDRRQDDQECQERPPHEGEDSIGKRQRGRDHLTTSGLNA